MQEGSRLLSSGIQFQPYSSIHRTNILPYVERLVNTGYFCASRSKDYAAKRLTRSDIPLPAKAGSPLSHILWKRGYRSIGLEITGTYAKVRKRDY
jgi:hypothetical protein